MPKTTQDIDIERRRAWRSFGGPTFSFIVGFLVAIALLYRGPILRTPVNWVNSWGQAAFVAFFFGAVAALAMYVVQIVFGRPFSLHQDFINRVVICDRCNQLKNRDGIRTCECGGNFSPIESWKWVEGDGAENGTNI
jgi:hypothetical protein